MLIIMFGSITALASKCTDIIRGDLIMPLGNEAVRKSSSTYLPNGNEIKYIVMF